MNFNLCMYTAGFWEIQSQLYTYMHSCIICMLFTNTDIGVKYICGFLVALYAYFIIDSFVKVSLQPSDFGKNAVGRRQNVICSISVPPDMDPDATELGWLNEDNIITDDSRVTINTSSDYHNDSTLVTIIQFDPLIEDDEGEYICFAIINGSFIIEYMILQNFASKLFFVCIYMCTYVHR